MRDTETEVCEDIKARQRLGVAKYGMRMSGGGGRFWREGRYPWRLLCGEPVKEGSHDADASH